MWLLHHDLLNSQRQVRRQYYRHYYPSGSTRSILWLLLMTLNISATIVNSCPLLCDCHNIDRKKSVSCKGQSLLTHVPDDMPTDTVDLDMSQTNLHTLHDNMFVDVPKLKLLDLQNAGIVTINPLAFSTLSDLKTLDLSSNSISRLHPGTFDGLIQLRRLVLANNRLEYLADNIFFNLNLDELQLENNPLRIITSATFNGSLVSTLVINGSRLNVVDSSALAPLKPSLISLTLSSNEYPLALHDLVFQQFALGDLTLSNNGLENATFLRSIAMIRTLDLHGNPLTDGLNFREYPAMRFVEHLNLKNISSIHLTLDTHFFATVKSLRYLDLSENRLEGLASGAIFRHIPNLTTLIMSDNKITLIPSDLGDYLPHLETLQLARNQISWLHEVSFSELKRLHHLDLRFNKIQIYPENMRIVFERVPFLQLDSNPLHCNCESRWFREFLGSYRPSTGADYCFTPNFSYVWDMEVDDFVCRAPQVRSISSNLTVMQGEDVLLHCLGDGDPAPKVQWTSPTGEIMRITPSSDRTITRTSAYWSIRAITPQKAGLYKCDVSNVGGSSSSTTCIYVVATPAAKTHPPTCSLPSNEITTFASGTRNKVTIVSSTEQSTATVQAHTQPFLHSQETPIEKVPSSSEETSSKDTEDFIDGKIDKNQIVSDVIPSDLMTSSKNGGAGEIPIQEIMFTSIVKVFTSVHITTTDNIVTNVTMSLEELAELPDWHVRLNSAQVTLLVVFTIFLCVLVLITTVIITVLCAAKRRKRMYNIQGGSRRQNVQYDAVRPHPANL